MTRPSVLIDGSQFLSKAATGIGSYGRTLVRNLRKSGAKVSVLYGQDVRTPRNASSLALAAQVFASEQRPESRLARIIRSGPFLASSLIGITQRTPVLEVSTEGVDLGAYEPPLPVADTIFNASRIYNRASLYFMLKDQLLPIDPPEGTKLAHWTGPVPVKAKGIPNIYTLHDVIPLQFPYFVIDRGALAVRLHDAIAREADHIITVSEASKRHIVDLLKVDEDRVSVTYQPTPSLPDLERVEAERLVETIYGAEPGKYALFLGAIEPKKNLKRLIEAFLIANPGVPLLLAGPKGWLNKEDLELIETVSANEKVVRHLGYLPRRHITALLKCARFFTFPSIYEGFGLPVLEAMQLGVPVLTSNTSSLPEVAGNAAVLVNPLDVADLTKGIRALANDSDLRSELSRLGPQQAEKFSEEVYRQRLATAYAKVGITLTGEA